MEPKSGVANRKLRKKPTFWANLLSYSSEFTGKTSLHGVQYLGEHKRSVYEKIWWIIIFVISIYMCTNLIVDTYQKWVRTPVMISSDADPVRISDIPFPAVTICPINTIRQTIFNITDYSWRSKQNNLTNEERELLMQLLILCLVYDEGRHLFLGDDVVDFIYQVSPTLSESLYVCVLHGEYNCSEMFTTVLTEKGICFTTNMLTWDEIYSENAYQTRNHLSVGPAKNWSLDRGYDNDNILETYPRRSFVGKSFYGTLLLLSARVDDLNYICTGPMQGFEVIGKVIVHQPGEIPKVESTSIHIAHDSDNIIRIKPHLMYTSSVLESYEPHQRNCYFEHEKKLMFYKKYSYDNCKAECLNNFTLLCCGCVPFYTPHTKNTPMCGIGKMQCLYEAKKNYYILQNKNNLAGLSEFEKSAYCDCLPSCTTMEFHAEHTTDAFYWTRSMTDKHENWPVPAGTVLTRIRLYYDESEFRKYVRQELYYDFTGLLANCGGLLGLFFGFSFLSLVEVIYFLTWRLFVNLRRYGKKYWSGSPEIIKCVE